MSIKVEESVTISRSPVEIYQFWRNFENLSKFMGHLKSVTPYDNTRSHWVAKAPLGAKVEWDAVITNEQSNKFISWRSVEDADIPNAGSVTFEPLSEDRGTIVRVILEYKPPLGALGAAVAKLFGEEPSQQIREDLRRLKQLLETGEIPTIEGQPMGAQRMTYHSPQTQL
jgi:uncharacterized membrane protein